MTIRFALPTVGSAFTVLTGVAAVEAPPHRDWHHHHPHDPVHHDRHWHR